MSLTNPVRHTDEDLERYVLGLLPEEATDRLDEASIVDDEIAARLRSVEIDLLDNYVRGQLAGATLERFERYYLSSPRRRERLEVAARFVRALDRSAPPVRRTTWRERLVGRTTLTRFVAAATLVMCVSGTLLFLATRPRNPTPLSAPATEGAVARDGSAATAPSSPPSVSSASQRPPGRLVAIVLFPPTRSIAPIPSLVLPTDADRIRFELRLESNDFSRYRVGLKDPLTNTVLWRSDWIGPTSSSDQASVSIVVPSTLLKAQHYALDLTGRGDGNPGEVIGSYPVRIAKP